MSAKITFKIDPKFKKKVRTFTDAPLIQTGKILVKTTRRLLRPATVKDKKRRIKSIQETLKGSALRKFNAVPVREMVKRITRAPSAPGTPPRSHKPGQVLRKSIVFGSNKRRNSIRVGQNRNVQGVGNIGVTQEFGKGTHPKRPFMSTALDNVLRSDKIDDKFKNILR